MLKIQTKKSYQESLCAANALGFWSGVKWGAVLMFSIVIIWTSFRALAGGDSL